MRHMKHTSLSLRDSSGNKLERQVLAYPDGRVNLLNYFTTIEALENLIKELKDESTI